MVPPRHEAWFYDGAEHFVEEASSFVRDGLEGDESVMVATTPPNLRGLREELGEQAEALALVDMTDAGRNPGRILSLWREFADTAAALGRRSRGIGEPVWSGRTPEELDECHRHEALINSAFNLQHDFWLVCPYDRAQLDAATLAAVERTHPEVRDRGGLRTSGAFDPALARRALRGLLAPPPQRAVRFEFDSGRLSALRTFVRDVADGAGLDPSKVEDLVLAANEVAANAIRHGRGSGTLVMWREGPNLLCQVDDGGRIWDPLVGRAKPTPEQLNGRGLWIVHELCDLVQIRASAEGNRIRLTLRLES